MNKHRYYEKGQALLEFGILMPILLILLLAGIAIAQSFYMDHMVQQATYEASRQLITENLKGQDSNVIAFKLSKKFQDNLTKAGLFSIRPELTSVSINGHSIGADIRCAQPNREMTDIDWKKGVSLTIHAQYCYKPFFPFTKLDGNGLLSSQSTLSIGIENDTGQSYDK